MLDANTADSSLKQTSFKQNIRLFVVCLAALSISLPIAWISLAKVLLFAVGLVYLIASLWTRSSDPALRQLWTTRVVLGILIVFALSLLWTEANTESALYSYVKHAKLLAILLVVSFIRTQREARLCLLFYAGGQGFLLLSSWLIFTGIPVPWAADTATKYVVFSTYLDQSIMFATMAAVFWHLRCEGMWPKWIGIAAAILALSNALLLLEGRTGYLVALTSMSLAVMWAMPKRFRLTALAVTPLAVLLSLTFMSAQVHERVTKIYNESVNYSKSQQVAAADSSGWRLNAWRRSVQAIATNPMKGHGVGAWTPAIKEFEDGNTATLLYGEGNHSNPHQEYLLWGVELGVVGLLLLIALMLCIMRDALRFPIAIQRATLSVLAALAIACLFNSTLYDDWIGDFFCISLGLLLAAGARNGLPVVALNAQATGR
jgi:O-antigen ligase